MEYIRHLTESGNWEFSNVRAVGNLSQLTTANKDDIVSAINEINQYFSLDKESLNDLVQAYADINETIEGLTNVVHSEQQKLIDQKIYLDEKVATITNNITNAETSLNEKIVESEGKIVTLQGKASEIEKELADGYEVLDGKIVKVSNDLVNTNNELSSKISKTEHDDNVGANNWIASFYDVVGGFATKYPKVEDFSGLTPSSIEDLKDSVTLYPFNTAKTGILQLFTNVRQDVAKTVQLSINHTDGMSVLLNGAYVYYQAGTKTANVSISLRAGWNTVEILLGVDNKVGKLTATSKLSDVVYKMTSKIGVGNKNDTRLSQAETLIKQTNDSITFKADKTVVESLGNQVTDNTAQIQINAEAIESKVGKDEFNNYTGRLSTAETKINQTATQIESLATKTELDTLNQTVSSQQSSITQMANSIDLKVGKAELDNVEERVELAEASIKVNSDAIRLKADQTSLDKATGEISNLQSELSVQAGQIKTKVSQTDINKAVNDISLGGKNLVLKSDKKVSVPASENNVASYFIHTYNLSEDWIVGETYTATIWGNVNAGQRFGIWANGTGTQVGVAVKVRDGLYRATFTVSKEPIIGGTTEYYGKKKLNVYNYPKETSGASDISFIQLEKGNKPTDWSPAPEDINERIANAETSITQTADNIKLKADKSIVDNIAGKVESVETELSVQAGVIKSKVSQTDINTAIDKIQIGGRNLLEKSSTATYQKTFAQTSPNYKAFMQFDITHVDSKIKVGDVVTISFDVQMEKGTRLDMYDSNAHAGKAFGSKFFTNIGTEARRLSWTTTVTDKSKGNKHFLDFYSADVYDDRFTIKNIKIELGNKATDYTIAPEDIENSIKSVESSITQTAESIEMKVKEMDVSMLASSPNLVTKTGIVNMGTTTNLESYLTNGVINLKTKGGTDGIYVHLPLKPNTDYVMRFIYQKVSGTFLSFGGHLDNVITSGSETYLDGVTTGLSFHNQTSAFLNDDTLEHEVVARFKTNDSISNRRIYIQPNRMYQQETESEFIIKEWQIEEGIHPSPWSLNPSDIYNRVSATETSISQTKEEIKFLAKKSEVEDLTGRLESAESNFSQTAENITLSVKSIVDNVKVGGRNLLVKSGMFEKYGYSFKSNGGGIELDETVLYNGQKTIKTSLNKGIISDRIYKLESGVEYTYSIMVKSSSVWTGTSITPAHFQAGVDGSTNQQKLNVRSYNQAYSTPNEWKLLWTTFTLTQGAYTFIPFVYGVNDVDINVAYFKLEKGNKPTDWSPAPEEVTAYTDNRVDGIVIGGRNLARFTNQAENMVRYQSTSTVTDYPMSNGSKNVYHRVTATTTTGHWGMIQNADSRLMELVNGESYTLSFKARANKELVLNYVYIMNSGGSNQSVYSEVEAKDRTMMTEWKEFVFPFKFSKSNGTLSYVMISNTSTHEIGDWFEVKDIMVEKGNKNSQWSPAPEDVEKKIESVESSITQKSNEIALNVTKSYVSSLETSDNLIPINSGWELGTQSMVLGSTQTKDNTLTTRLRFFDNPIPVVGGAIYSLVNDNLDFAIAFHELDKDLKFVKDSGWLVNRQHKWTMQPSTTSIRLLVRSQASLSMVVKLEDILNSKFCLVKGEVYQSWKPSQKDLETKVQAQLSVQAEQISSKVTSSQVSSAILSDKRIKDTRAKNELPSWYWANYPMQTVEEFKSVATMGVNNTYEDGSIYGLLTTQVRWNDKSGGRVKQVLTTDIASYEREGSADGASWGTWKKMVDQATMGTFVTQTLNSWGVDVVRNGNILSSINASTEGIKILGDKIDITGAVTLSALDSSLKNSLGSIETRDNQFGYKYYKKIIMYGDSTSTYYPVIIKAGNQDVKREILIKRGYAEQAPNDWNTAVHKGGLTCKIKTNFGGWGGAQYSWEISELEESYVKTFGGATHTGNNAMFAIFLRGGGTTGAVYHLYSDQPLDASLYDTLADGTKLPAPQIAYSSNDIIFRSVASTGGETIVRAPAPRTYTTAVQEEIRRRKYVSLSQATDTQIGNWKYAGTTYINGGQIYTDSITTNQIASGAITANEIATDAITANKIQAGAITTTKIASDAIDGKTITGSIVKTSSAYNRGVVIDSNGIKGFDSSGTQKFYLDTNGKLTATGAVINGSITASEDSIFKGNISTANNAYVGNNIYLGENMSGMKQIIFSKGSVISGGHGFVGADMALSSDNLEILCAKVDFTQTALVDFTGVTVMGVTPTFG